MNVSKSGVGYSVGGRGFRVGTSARGRKYTSVSIPGTGLRYTKSHGRASQGCLVALLGAMVIGLILQQIIS